MVIIVAFFEGDDLARQSSKGKPVYTDNIMLSRILLLNSQRLIIALSVAGNRFVLPRKKSVVSLILKPCECNLDRSVIHRVY